MMSLRLELENATRIVHELESQVRQLTNDPNAREKWFQKQVDHAIESLATCRTELLATQQRRSDLEHDVRRITKQLESTSANAEQQLQSVDADTWSLRERLRELTRRVDDATRVSPAIAAYQRRYPGAEQPLTQAVLPPVLVRDKCLQGTANQAACLNKTRVMYHAEYAYPPFVLPMPKFASREDHQWFLQNNFTKQLLETSQRCTVADASFCVRDSHQQQQQQQQQRQQYDDDAERHLAYYTPQHVRGHISAVRNGVYRGWVDCGQSTPLEFFTKVLERNEYSSATTYDSLVSLVCDGGWSFQHFIDNVFPKIAHAWELIGTDANVKLLVDLTDRRHKPVLELLKFIGFDEQRIVRFSLSHKLVARELLVPCHAPPIHPFLWSKMQALLGVAQVPLSERRIISYLSRSNRKEHANAGRTVLNEHATLEALREWAQRRQPPMQLEVFSSSALGTPERVVEYFERVAVMIGPHGGAFYNQVFAPRDTVLVEFMPVLRSEFRSTMRHPARMVWTMAGLLNQTYYQMPCEASRPDDTADMEVDITKLIAILDRAFS